MTPSCGLDYCPTAVYAPGAGFMSGLNSVTYIEWPNSKDDSVRP